MSTDKNFYAVVLAGGSGTRFWPMSRQARPKQFLNITGKGSLLQETISRIRSEMAPANIWIVTNAGYRREVERQIASFGIPRSNVLLEPEGKNTAPAIGWAAALIHRKNPDAVMAVLPSDHLIAHPKNFLQVLRQSVTLARQDYLVTLGIVPTRPETGYGYLKIKKTASPGQGVIRVERFVEKPPLAKARQFVRQKSYLWNSGMFIWKSAVILRAFEKHLPEVAHLLRGKITPAQVRKIWGKMPSISVDYGILEKADHVAAVPARDIGWSDLGSWESLAEVLSADERGNFLRGDVIALDCAGSFVWGEKRLVAAVGLKDLIIIDTPDAVLVCRKDMSQRIKDIVTMLRQDKRKEI